jgi:hypothetical protein
MLPMPPEQSHPHHKSGRSLVAVCTAICTSIWFSTDRYGPAGDIVLDGTNHSFDSRAAAGFPEVGGYPKNWRDFRPMMPSAGTGPIGNVRIPAG